MITKIFSIIIALSCAACAPAPRQKDSPIALKNQEDEATVHFFTVTKDRLEAMEMIHERLDVPYAEYYRALDYFSEELDYFLSQNFEKRRAVLSDAKEQSFIYLYCYFSDFEERMKNFERFVMNDPENKDKPIEDFLIDVEAKTMIIKGVVKKLCFLNGNFKIKV